MVTFTVMVLLCATSTPIAACDEHTAIDVIKSRAASELGCAINWQQSIARGSLREGVGDTLYMKTMCVRRASVTPGETATALPLPASVQ